MLRGARAAGCDDGDGDGTLDGPKQGVVIALALPVHVHAVQHDLARACMTAVIPTAGEDPQYARCQEADNTEA